MRSQPHYASARANRFIAMDIIDPAVDFLALGASMGVTARELIEQRRSRRHLKRLFRPNLIEIPLR